jgi:hypothetical protein
MLGWDYTSVFWKQNWFLPLIFVAILALLNTYFLLNWRLFQLLENEDWENLVTYLEQRVFEKKQFSNQNIRLLINGYLLQSNVDGIRKLEEFLKEQKPGMVTKFALSFGIPYLLQNDSEQMEQYYKQFLDNEKGEESNWIHWNYSFALLMQQRREEAKDILLRLSGRAREPLLQLLTAYLLEAFSGEEEVRERITDVREKLRNKYNRSQWDKEINKAKSNIQVVVLSKLVQDATEWLFSSQEEQKG